jgi:hypothetical protein
MENVLLFFVLNSSAIKAAKVWYVLTERKGTYWELTSFFGICFKQKVQLIINK